LNLVVLIAQETVDEVIDDTGSAVNDQQDHNT
jgi:hypothetical protein